MAAPVTLDGVRERLTAAGCVAAHEEAELLVAGAPDHVTLDAWLRRRELGEPLAWIVGTTVFCGRTLHAVPGVYVPRAQTEDLAVRAAALLPPGGRAVDLCTGIGAIAAHLAAVVPSAWVVGVDVEPIAVACARRNGVTVVLGDLGTSLAGTAAVDVVTAVPPYVPTDAIPLLPADVTRFEPRRALDGGTDGLDVARRVVADAGRLLRPTGWLLVEVGGDQDVALGPALEQAGFDRVEPWCDDDGDLRGLAARFGDHDGAAVGRPDGSRVSP